jgi:hypothetical protein
LSIIASSSFGGVTSLKTIAEHVAKQNNKKLEWKVKNDKQIGSFSYTGPVAKQVQKLAECGDVNAYVDNDTLVVIDSNAPRTEGTILIDEDGGMVGIPQPVWDGVLVKVMAASTIQLGGKVNIQSKLNPSVDGEYYVWQINFEIASRDHPFWYTLYCKAPPYVPGTV